MNITILCHISSHYLFEKKKPTNVFEMLKWVNFYPWHQNNPTGVSATNAIPG